MKTLPSRMIGVAGEDVSVLPHPLSVAHICISVPGLILKVLDEELSTMPNQLTGLHSGHKPLQRSC